MVATVDLDCLQVAADLGIQRRALVWLGFAQQADLVRRHAGLDHGHLDRRAGIRPHLQGLGGLDDVSVVADPECAKRKRRDKHDDDAEAAYGAARMCGRGSHESSPPAVSPRASRSKRSSRICSIGGFRRKAAYAAGTTNSVGKVATISPPITARPSGAFCSPHSPRASAIGTMPMIMAIAVISTGRRRTLPASIAASTADKPRSVRRSLAKLTTRIELDTAMPTDITAPISDSTLIVVPVSASIHKMPTRAPGTARMMISGSSQDWNSTTIRQYTRITASTMPRARLENDEFITWLWPRSTTLVPAGRPACWTRSITPWMSLATPPRSRPCTFACTSITRCTV